MLRTRLWMGTCLVLLMFGVLVLDLQFQPYYPFLGLFVGLVGFLGVLELRGMLPTVLRPHPLLAVLGVLAVLSSPWLALCAIKWSGGAIASVAYSHCSIYLFVAVLGAGFLLEMATFYGPDGAIGRLCGLSFLAAYLGLLPCFLTQLRWLAPLEGHASWGRSTAALVLCIFTPKVGDIAAYFTGRSLGRRPMSPVLSPKKTLEGGMGGILGTTIFAVVVQLIEPVIEPGGVHGVLSAALLGVMLGVVGILGDLAESLLKRDAGAKDASQTVPGFGGVLDVIDSILFCAPVVYCWLI